LVGISLWLSALTVREDSLRRALSFLAGVSVYLQAERPSFDRTGRNRE
jgi:hypothetical protein